MKASNKTIPRLFRIVAFSVLVNASGTVLGDTQSDSSQLHQALTNITDVTQLQQEIKKIGRACQKHEFLKEMVFDVTVPIEARITLAHLLGNYANDLAFAKKVLGLPSSPEANRLKVALIQGYMEPGAHIGMPFDTIKITAKNAKEDVEVRQAAIRLIINIIKRKEDKLKQKPARDQFGADSLQEEVDLNRKVLQEIATTVETPFALKEMIERDLPVPSSNLVRMTQKLKKLQGILKRAEDQAKAIDLPPIERYQVLMNVWSGEQDVIQSEMFLIMELLRIYASEHDGTPPLSIPELADFNFMRGPYHFFKVPTLTDLSPDIILVVAPKLHEFADGKIIFIESSANQFEAIPITEFNAAVTAGSKKIKLAPSMREMLPVLYVLKGDGHVLGYPKHMIDKVVAMNNVKRKEISAPLVNEEMIASLFEGVNVPEAIYKQGRFSLSAEGR